MEKVQLGPQTLTYPMPTLLIGANVDGKPNFMTLAWSGIVNSIPPMISAALRHERHTLKGVRQNMTFSVNIPSVDLVKEADYCGFTPGEQVNKAAVCGFKVSYGKLGNAPLIEQCPVNLECRVVHLLDMGSHTLVIGRIEETHVAQECLTDGKPDVTKIRPIIYTRSVASSDYYAYGECIGKAFSIGKALKEKE